MPRNGQGVFTLPPVYNAVTGETIEAQQHNVPLEDLAKDANDPRPITTGGTGAGSAAQARTNLDVYSKDETVSVISGAVAKDPPIDADGIIITDSADSGKPKKVLWSVIKARLKAFFDPIYQVALANVPNIELNSGLTANSGSFIDFHAVFPATDFDARLIRNTGANGTFDFLNNGEGQMRFFANAGSYFNRAMFVNGRVTAVQEFMVQASSAAGNSHTYYMAEDGATIRAITYAQQNKKFIIAVNGGSVGFSFNTDGNFFAPSGLYSGNGTGYFGTDGNFSGTAWDDWGAHDGKSAINARIEQRANDWAVLRANNAQNYAISQIMPMIAAQGAGGVGTYAMLKAVSGGAPEPGTLKAGSELQYSNANGDGSGTPGGTWLCCGRSIVTSTTSTGAVTLYLKKAA